MHPLESLDEAELGSLARAADRLLANRHLLAPGQHGNRLRPGSGIEFLDHREYSPGDDIRAVDWRASARSRHPQLRRYSDEAAADWFILLDCSSSMAIGQRKKWALALQCAAAMAYLLIHLGNRVGVVLFADSVERVVPPGRGYLHYAGILQSLRRAVAAESGAGSSLRCCVPAIRRNSPVFVISDFLAADGMQAGLDALSMRGDRLHALQILSRHDHRLPAGRSVRFRDVENGVTLSAALSARQREDYLRACQAFDTGFAHYCRRRRIHFSRHGADLPWKSVLLNHLKTGGGAQ